jgi:hypothetical protein
LHVRFTHITIYRDETATEKIDPARFCETGLAAGFDTDDYGLQRIHEH